MEGHYRLIVKQPNNLLSVVIDREITLEQLKAIEIVLSDDKTAFNVVEDKRIEALMSERYPGVRGWFGWASSRRPG